MGIEPLKPLEHKFKAFVFAVVKLFLKEGRKDFKIIDGNKINKVLFLRPEKIGDMVISFPVFDGMKKHFPQIKISLLGSPKNYAIIKNDKRFEKLYMYTKNPLKDMMTLLKMRRGNYDCVIDMIGDDSVTALFISQLTAKGKPRIGIGKTKFQNYYDYNYAYRTDNKNHVIENTLKLLDAFGIDSSKISGYAEPYLTEEELTFAGKYTDSLRQNSSTMLVGFNISAGHHSRVYPEDKTIEVINRILAEHAESKIIIIVTPNERKKAEALQAKFKDRVEIVPDKLSLTKVSAVVKYLDILISPDTSIVHIGRACQVPVVGLYTQFMKNFTLWRPYGQESGAVVSHNDGNVFDIKVDEIVETFNRLVMVRRTNV